MILNVFIQFEIYRVMSTIEILKMFKPHSAEQDWELFPN